MPDEGTTSARVFPGDCVAQASGEAGVHLLGNRQGQSLKYCLDYLLCTVVGAHTHGGRRVSVDDQSPGGNDLHGPHGAFVLGHVGRGNVHDGRMGQGTGVGVGTIDEPGHLRAGLAQVDVH